MAGSIRKFYEDWHQSAGENRALELRDRDLMAIDYLKDCKSVFELGCGSGTILNMLSGTTKVGVDISSKAIEIADKIVQAAEHKDLRALNIDDEELPWDSEKFDGCMAIEVLEHLFDPVHALAELNRVLKKDGKIVVTVPNIGYFVYRHYHLVSGEVSDFHGNGLIVNEHIRYYCSQSITKLLELTGFGNIKVKGAMKEIVRGRGTGEAGARQLTLNKLLYAIRPTPINVFAKANRIFRLWERYPSLFAVGLVVEATKIGDSPFKFNGSIDHQLRTPEQVKININNLS